VRPAERRVLEATIAMHIPLSDTATAAIVMPQPVKGGCRSKVDDRRCGHARDAHIQVGFYAGERTRCACGCKGYTSPLEDAMLVVIGLGLALLITALFWLVMVPALLEMLT
jgi:hypothetical protein